MVDDVKDITETAESKAATEALDRARLARERREAEQRKRLDELRAHAAAAQAQREKRDEDRRRRQAEQRARDEDRRVQVEERKRAIWEASVSRRESLLQREKDRSERLERARASRSSPRPAFAFGSSTPRLLEPVDSGGFFWAARRAASTTNVMYASAPLTRRASALHLDSSDEHNKDEAERPQPLMWSSVARRRTDLVPTIPAPRLQGRAYSMTRLDRIPSRPLQGAESVQHLNRQPRSGETTPGSRPGSALSAHAQVVRRTASAPRRPRPASIAGTGMNTPRGNGAESVSASLATTPVVSRDASTAERRARRPRPLSMHAAKTPQVLTPGEGKPPLHRKPKLSKDHEKSGRVKSVSASPRASAERNPELNAHEKNSSTPHVDKCQVSAIEVTQKLEALQIQNGHDHVQLDSKVIENKENVEPSAESKPMEVSQQIDKPVELQKPVEKREEKKESQDKTEENEMTASMSARRITTEEQAKAALAERRRRAREELERQAEIERLRLQREAEEEAERQRVEEERQRREEQEARELARLQREMEEEKLRKAIEAQQQLERDEAERKSREEAEKVVRLKEEEEKKKAAEEAEKVRREEAEREERERVLRKQRVEEIMMRTRLRKAEEDKKQQESKVSQPPTDNGNAEVAMHTSQSEVKTSQQDSLNSTPNETKSESNPTNNGNTVDLLGLSEQNDTEDKKEITTNNTQNSISSETSNGNHPTSDIGHISANFIQTERLAESQSKMAEPSKMADVKLIEDDFTTHNGHNASHNNHPLTLQNAI